jgi:hypothetical protein
MAGRKAREVKRLRSDNADFWLLLVVGLAGFRHLPTTYCSSLIVLSCQLHKERVIGVEAIYIFRSY